MAENKMLKLAAKIRELTYGMCRVGAGPYGFGVINTGPSKIGIVVSLQPDPFGEKPLPPGVECCTATLSPYLKSEDKKIDMAAIQILSEESDPATRLVAVAVIETGRAPLILSIEECSDAFSVMAECQMKQDDELTHEEAVKLSGLRWWERKTAEEIVDFQLYEKLLCMPFERFHEAVETVFGRGVCTHEFADSDRLRDEYRSIKEALKQRADMEKLLENHSYIRGHVYQRNSHKEYFFESTPEAIASYYNIFGLRHGSQPCLFPYRCLSYNKRSNWLTKASLGLHVRNKDCQPSSCCSVRFEQVEPWSSRHQID